MIKKLKLAFEFDLNFIAIQTFLKLKSAQFKISNLNYGRQLETLRVQHFQGQSAQDAGTERYFL